ncbi:hypothetical protein G6F24_017608 [Rhizopus arrhizus]|nr:hypothetical protein G6F24_017608 [Rhizopus arrhizus]
MKTFSMATSLGWYSRHRSARPSTSSFMRCGKSSAPSSTSGWWCTWLTRPAASTSMMPTPVRCEPGSMPRMRVMPHSWRDGTGSAGRRMGSCLSAVTVQRPAPRPSGRLRRRRRRRVRRWSTRPARRPGLRACPAASCPAGRPRPRP